MWGWIIGSAVIAVIVWYFVHTISPPAHRSGGSIDAFIGEDKSEVRVKRVSKYALARTEPGRQILVAFGTEYGFSEEVAKKIFDSIEEASGDLLWQPRLLNLRNYTACDLAKEQALVVVCSTAGDGVPPTEARAFFDFLQRAQPSLSHLHFATLALGDTAYPHFARAGTILDEQIKALGGKQLTTVTKVDLEDWSLIDRWISNILTLLRNVTLEVRTDYLDLSSITQQDTGFSRIRPFASTLTVKRLLTPPIQPEEKDPKEVIHAEFDLSDSGLSYTAGDALGIYPINNPAEVTDLLTALDTIGHKQTETVQWPATYYGTKPTDNASLSDVLLLCYDLKTVKPELVSLLANNATEPRQVEKGKELLQAGQSLKENKLLNTYIQDREVRDVVRDFSSSKVKLSEIISNLRTLQPRYYSISSSSVVSPTTCCVTAAVVRYSLLTIPRTGVTTTFLADRLAVTQKANVFISQNPHFRLPQDSSRAIVMIGPGTGIAPFRAFLQERVKTAALGKNVLYFGCRHRHVDFLYKDELETLEKEGSVELHLAFSRDQENKLYVQHLIEQDAQALWTLLEQHNAHVYVCGDATHMAGDVHQALLRILQEQGNMSQSDAEAYMDRLEKEERYQRDVWVT